MKKYLWSIYFGALGAGSIVGIIVNPMLVVKISLAITAIGSFGMFYFTLRESQRGLNDHKD